MRRQQLREQDLVEVKLPVCRSTFEAHIEGFDEDGHVRIRPVEKWPTWRRVQLTDITKRLYPPPRTRRGRKAPCTA